MTRSTRTLLIFSILTLPITSLYLWNSKKTAETVKALSHQTQIKQEQVKKNENTLHLTRKINDNNIKQKVTQTLETLPSSDDTDALVTLANTIIRTGRENRQRNSQDVSE